VNALYSTSKLSSSMVFFCLRRHPKVCLCRFGCRMRRAMPMSSAMMLRPRHAGTDSERQTRRDRHHARPAESMPHASPDPRRCWLNHGGYAVRTPGDDRAAGARTVLRPQARQASRPYGAFRRVSEGSRAFHRLGPQRRVGDRLTWSGAGAEHRLFSVAGPCGPRWAAAVVRRAWVPRRAQRGRRVHPSRRADALVC